MPRFDPHYLTENDGLRVREAGHALVNARGHYLGAAPALVAAGMKLLPGQIAPTLKNLSPVQKKQAIKNNKSKIVAELRAKGIQNITVNDDGTLHLGDFASGIDAAVRALLNTPTASFVFDQTTKKVKPGPVKKLSDSIDALPLLNADQKRALKQAPFTTMLNAATGVLGVLNNPQSGILVDVMKNTGSVFDLSTFPFNIPGATRVDISLVQDGDELFDEPSRSNLLRLRTLTAFVVLYFRKWVELHAALAAVGLEFLFGKDDTRLVRVGAGGDGSSFDKPRVVTSMPLVWRGGTRREIPAGPYLIAKYTSGGLPTRRDLDDVTKLVWEIPQDNRKGQTRAFVQLTQSSWDDWRRQHAGLIDARLSEGRAINGLGGLGALGTFGAEIAAILVALEGFCVSVGPAVTVAIATGVFLTTAFAIGITATIILAAMGKEFSFFVDVKEGKAGASTEKGPPPPGLPLPPTQKTPTLPGGEGTLQTQSTGGGVSPLLIGGAVLAAIFMFKKGSKA